MKLVSILEFYHDRVVNSLLSNKLCLRCVDPGDEAASFTKEEMQQGKHTDYERLLHEQLFLCNGQKEGR